MKITFNPNILMPPQLKSDKKASKQNPESFEYSYNPIAYRDYNVTFGQRLLRSPENFYEQDFNEKNMPKTLHDYIYTTDEDMGFRKRIPPAQAMEIVFEDLKQAEDLDDVKILYPDEPLFEALKAKPKVNSREGVLGMLNVVKDDPEYENRSLFKNGKNDLGIYILKKIYLEGKTFDEIKKDFSKDVSVYYGGFELTPRDYMAYGIKFPKKSFWNSFLATRDDRNFHRIVIPKELQDGSKRTPSVTGPKVSKPKKLTINDTTKQWEIDSITNDIISSGGNSAIAQKKLRKRSSEANSFVAKYLSEIMSVTMERLHMSPELKSFFEHYEDTNDSQQKKLKKYWATPDAKEKLSYVMKSTIQMFMDAYDEDGNNEVFQDLLEYAHNIKPERESAQRIHDEIQAGYDQLLEGFDMDAHLNAYLAKTSPEPETEPVPEPELRIQESELQVPQSFEEIFSGVNMHVEPLGDDKAIFPFDRKIYAEEIIKRQYSCLPTQLQNKMIHYLINNATEEYLVATAIKYFGHEMLRFGMSSEGQSLDLDFGQNMLEQVARQCLERSEELKATQNSIDDIDRYISAKLGYQDTKKNPWLQAEEEIERGFKQQNRALVNASMLAMAEILRDIPFESDEYIKKALELRGTDSIPDEKLRLDTESKIANGIIRAGKILHNPRVLDCSLHDFSLYMQKIGLVISNDTGKNLINDRINYYLPPLTTKEKRKLELSMTDILLNANFPVGTKDVSAAMWKIICENVKEHPQLKPVLRNLIKKSIIDTELGSLRCLLNDNDIPPEVKNMHTVQIIRELLANKDDYRRKEIALLAAMNPGKLCKYMMATSVGMYSILSAYTEEAQEKYLNPKK